MSACKSCAPALQAKLGCHSEKACAPITHFGQKWERCPLADWRDATLHDQAWVDAIYRLVTAKRQGCIVYPDGWSAATLDAIEALENAMYDYEKYTLSPEGRKDGV